MRQNYVPYVGDLAPGVDVQCWESSAMKRRGAASLSVARGDQSGASFALVCYDRPPSKTDVLFHRQRYHDGERPGTRPGMAGSDPDLSSNWLDTGVVWKWIIWGSGLAFTLAIFAAVTILYLAMNEELCLDRRPWWGPPESGDPNAYCSGHV